MRQPASWKRLPAAVRAALVLGGLVLVGCGSAPPPNVQRAPSATLPPSVTPQPYPTATNHPVATTGCGQASPVTPGTTANQTIPAFPAVSHGASTRTYLVHVPPSYQANVPLPVVLAFHGHGGDAAGMEQLTGFSALADQQGFLAVYPQGLLFTDDTTFWASAGPIDEGIDDVLFVSTVLDDLQHKFCVDASRVYATGFSNGGGMTYYLACALSGRIAAFAPVSGNYYRVQGGCDPARPVPILEIHGTADGIVPYMGLPGAQNGGWPLPAIPDWLQGWASHNGCADGPVIFLQSSYITGERWTGCQGNAEVAHYRMEGEGHAWPASIDGPSGAAVIWQFFQAHPLPG
jgi:polyhydroxybutyrate depolymerase